MVRINLIAPEGLTDQHLIAEYLEILMLIGSIKNKEVNLTKIPERYCLGKGHQLFFRDKLKYLKKRHELIKKEMKKRGFKTNHSLDISKFNNCLKQDFCPDKRDRMLIKKRLAEKISLKPSFYRYYSKHKPKSFFINLIKNAC
ncbi:MAG: pyrimidine dimer DNA glycosylase/endonuclease V [Candidatus Pacearchaeota archaeon]